MAFLSYTEKFFDPNSVFRGALNNELRHHDVDFQNLDGDELDQRIQNKLQNEYDKMFTNQQTLTTPANNKFTQNYIWMSKYFYHACMGAIQSVGADQEEIDTCKEKAKKELFFCYKKVPGMADNFVIGCYRTNDPENVVTRHFNDETDEIFILVRDVMKKFIKRDTSFFSQYFPPDSDGIVDSKPFFEFYDSVKIFFPIIHQFIGKEIALLRITDSDSKETFEEEFVYPERELRKVRLEPNVDGNFLSDKDQELFAMIVDPVPWNSRFFKRNETNPAFIQQIEGFYETNKDKNFKNALNLLQLCRKARGIPEPGTHFLQQLERGNYKITTYPKEDFLRKNFFFDGNKKLLSELAWLKGESDDDKLLSLRGILNDMRQGLNEAVKYMHATVGGFKKIDIEGGGLCGWNSIIWCIYGENEEKDGRGFLEHRNQLIDTYVKIRMAESTRMEEQPDKLLFSPQEPILYTERGVGDEYNWQIKKGVEVKDGNVQITWENHTAYLQSKPETLLYASGEDIQIILACLGVMETNGSLEFVNGNGKKETVSIPYRNTRYQSGEDITKMVTWCGDHDAEYDWTFKIINNGDHWEILEKKDKKRLDGTRAYLQRAFEALVKDPKEYDLDFTPPAGKYITESKMVV